LYAARGANVVVNDFNQAAAQKVVDEIKQGAYIPFQDRKSLGLMISTLLVAGGKAVVNNSSVTDGAAVIKSALDAFGGVSILINNAGILRDKGYVIQTMSGLTRIIYQTARSFRNMSDQEWDQIYEVHLKGAYACAKAAWPIFRKQKYGRIINTASAAGLYGAFITMLLFNYVRIVLITLGIPQATSARQTIVLQKWVLSPSPRRWQEKEQSTISEQLVLHQCV
jgi:multifunctional beta-oxidation protein